MAKIIYLEDTIALMANTGKMNVVKQVAKLGEFTQTKNGYRYIVLDEGKKNDICPIHSTLLNEDGSCNKCLNENNK
jgi:hypothetical protein